MNKQVVLISGASSGLGKGLAQKLSQLGYRVYGGYNLTKSISYDKNLIYAKLDVTSEKDCKRVIKYVVNNQKRIDILINCAGISPFGDTLGFTPEQFLETLQVNVIGAFRLIKEVVPTMQKKGGLIINITSLNSFISFPHSGIYSASKFALDALGFALRQELSTSNIKVVNVAPGFFIKNNLSTNNSIIKKIFPYTKQEHVEDEIINLITRNNFAPRVIVGTDAKIMYFLLKIMPFSLLDKIISRVWGKRGSLALRNF